MVYIWGLAEEEREEAEEEKNASLFKKIALLLFIVVVATLVFLFLHISKMNREAEQISTVNEFAFEELKENENVLGIESEKLESAVTVIMDVTGVVVEEKSILKEAKNNGETMEGYGFGYGAETSSVEIDKLYENVRMQIEEEDFELVTEKVEGLELPLTAFISYKKDGIICNIVRMEIEEKESSEIEIGCFEKESSE